MTAPAVAITQPNFLPWEGFFALLDTVDVWVNMDYVQVSRKSNIVRNKIWCRTNDWKFLTVPVASGQSEKTIRDCLIGTNNKWRESHQDLLRDSYSNSRFFSEVFPVLKAIYEDDSLVTLGALNSRFISEICSILGINIEVINSSELLKRSNGEYASPASLAKSLGAKSFFNFKNGLEKGIVNIPSFHSQGIEVFGLEYSSQRAISVEKDNNLDLIFLSVVDVLFKESRSCLPRIRNSVEWKRY